MMRKRLYLLSIVGIVLGLLLAPNLLAGGQSEQATQAGTQTLSMWTLFTGGEGSIMADLISEFNDTHDDITIEEQVVEWDQYYNRLLTSLVGGNAPDIAIMHLAVLPDYASRGVLNPIGAQLPGEFQDLFLSNILEKARYEDELYAIPIDTHPIVLYYNKSVLQEAGVTDDSGNALVPETWEELFEYAATVHEETGKYGLTSETGAMFGERLFTGLYAQLGGELVDAAGSLQIDRDIAESVYDIMLEPYRQGFAEGPADYEDSEALFQDNQSAFHINGVWAMSVYPDMDGFEFGVTQIPAVSGSDHRTWGDSHSIVFPRTGDDAKLAAALTFGEWLSGKTMEWAAAGHVPVNESVLESEEFLGLPMREDYLAAAGNAVLAPSVEGWSRVREEMWEIGEALILGDITVEQGADRLDAFLREQ
jgi:multiple sugar transport system substrate-binding protein